MSFFPFPDHQVSQNKELDTADRLLVECVSMKYKHCSKGEWIICFQTNAHYITYPVVTMWRDTSGGDNQASFTSKHFHVDFFFQ